MRHPIHIQVLLSLKEKVESRLADLREKAGNGLADQEYQRHVGRIRECATLIEEIDVYLKTGVDALEEADEDNDDERPRTQRARRPAKSAR